MRGEGLGGVLTGALAVAEREEDVVRIISARWATEREADRFRIETEHER